MYFGLALLYLKQLYVGPRDSSVPKPTLLWSAKLARYCNTSSVCPGLLDSVDDHRMALRIREITAPCNFPQRTTTADIVGDQPCRCANNVQTRSNGMETYQVNP